MESASDNARTARSPTDPPTAPAKVAMLCCLVSVDLEKSKEGIVNTKLSLIQISRVVEQEGIGDVDVVVEWREGKRRRRNPRIVDDGR